MRDSICRSLGQLLRFVFPVGRTGLNIQRAYCRRPNGTCNCRPTLPNLKKNYKRLRLSERLAPPEIPRTSQSTLWYRGIQGGSSIAPDLNPRDASHSDSRINNFQSFATSACSVPVHIFYVYVLYCILLCIYII